MKAARYPSSGAAALADDVRAPDKRRPRVGGSDLLAILDAICRRADPLPRDLVLFPSYVLHAVPPNQGERRIPMSFNAIPGGFNSWGYSIKFSA